MSGFLASLIFPSLIGQSNCYVNLDLEARQWHYNSEADSVDNRNPLLDPQICQQMIEHINGKYQVNWTYGGYLEDRTFLWRNSYLEQDSKFIHLGVDYNIPAGTPVTAPSGCQVLEIDDDHDLEGGWGPRVIVELCDPRCSGNILVFAHLGNIECVVGQRLTAGERFAVVGAPPTNGNWFPHLHLQAVEPSYFRALQSGGLGDLDGYGHLADIAKLSLNFPDPSLILSSLLFNSLTE